MSPKLGTIEAGFVYSTSTIEPKPRLVPPLDKTLSKSKLVAKVSITSQLRGLRPI